MEINFNSLNKLLAQNDFKKFWQKITLCELELKKLHEEIDESDDYFEIFEDLREIEFDYNILQEAYEEQKVDFDKYLSKLKKIRTKVKAEVVKLNKQEFFPVTLAENPLERSEIGLKPEAKEKKKKSQLFIKIFLVVAVLVVCILYTQLEDKYILNTLLGCFLSLFLSRFM